ncbi:Serine/threonine-protein kinase, partial [Borealophlyctis nickersoniae]
MAPEILRGDRYDAKADLWSLGAILYEMTTGRPPFKAQNHIDLLRKIDRGEGIIRFPGDEGTAEGPSRAGRRVGGALSSSPTVGSLGSSPRFAYLQGVTPISDNLKDLIRRLLKRNPIERMTFEEFFMHPCVLGHRASAGGVYNPSSVEGGAERPPVVGRTASNFVGGDARRSSVSALGHQGRSELPFAVGPPSQAASGNQALYDVTNSPVRRATHSGAGDDSSQRRVVSSRFSGGAQPSMTMQQQQQREDSGVRRSQTFSNPVAALARNVPSTTQTTPVHALSSSQVLARQQSAPQAVIYGRPDMHRQA